MDNKIELKLRTTIREIIQEIIKEAKASHNVQVYLKAGESAPKGVKVSTGARGGKYYYTKGAAQGGKHVGYPKQNIDKLKKEKDKLEQQWKKASGNDEKVALKKLNKVIDALAKVDKTDTKSESPKKTEKDVDTIKKEYDEVSKKSGNYGADEKLDYLTKAFPKIDEKDLENALFIQQTFANSAPEDYSEMQQASRDAKWFDKFMKKHPELEKIGFDEEVVYDPK